MITGSIIIVESGRLIYERFSTALLRQGHQLRCLTKEQALVPEFTARSFDLIIAAEPLPRMSLAELMGYLRKHNLNVPIIVIAQNGIVQQAIEAIRLGAADYLLASDDEALLHKRIEKILLSKAKAPIGKSVGRPALPNIISQSTHMRQLLEMAQRIAPSAATVLIQGESGTGKELLARFIHGHSGRTAHPFVAMNCAALPENLAESELFGYERGAFTGALQRKSGKFELAQNGTLLLDEISEMPLALQAKLLRVLQEKEVDRVGGQNPIPIDVRVIATTNRDLSVMVNEGQFRKDLYYRLRIIPLTIPPLRQRPEDIPLLVDYFITKYGSPGETPLPRFDPAAMEKLAAWPWPGNVRELENTVERAMLLRNGSVIGPSMLFLDEQNSTEATAAAAGLVGLTVRELEERLIEQTLRHVNQNRTHAAEMLGISIRTLRNKLREYRQEDGEEPSAAEQGR